MPHTGPGPQGEEQMKHLKTVSLTAMVALACLIHCSGCTQVAMKPLPEGAIVLFDGTDFAQWKHPADSKAGRPATEEIKWKIVDDAMEIMPRTGSIITKQNFHDFKLHVEFMIPERAPDDTRRFFGNSGVYIQGRYEVQILDSYGVELELQDCGAIYKTRVPDKNVCKKPGQWQSYDITFRAPRFEGRGKNAKKIENARVTVLQNGVMIHNDVEIPDKTGSGWAEGPEPGPILLQEHGHKVQFRNIWIIPLGQEK